MSNANCARLSPVEAASSISLKSELTPDIPKTPDFLFKDSETSSIVYPHSSTKKELLKDLYYLI